MASVMANLSEGQPPDVGECYVRNQMLRYENEELKSALTLTKPIRKVSGTQHEG